MNDKDKFFKPELKETAPAMRIDESQSQSESKPLLPTAGIASSDANQSDPASDGDASRDKKIAVTMPALFDKAGLNRELFSKLTSNKYAVCACVFILLQALVLFEMQNPSLYMYLGNEGNFGAQNKDREANFKEALFLNPQNEHAAASLARLAFSNGEFEKALKYANQSLQMKPSAAAYDVLGLTYIGQNNLNDAEKSFAALRKEFPEFEPYRSQALLAWTEKQLGNDGVSDQLYKNALLDRDLAQLAIDFHHMGYFSREGISGFPVNSYLAIAGEDITLALHIERFDALRRWFAHINKSGAYNDIYQPNKALDELRIVAGGTKASEAMKSLYVNLKVSDRLLGNYAALARDATAEAKLNNWSENSFDLAEVAYFNKDYKAAIKYADDALEGYGDDDEPWALLFKKLSKVALNQKTDLTSSRKSFQTFLKSEIVKLRKNNLNKRADDLQQVLKALSKGQ